MFPLRSVESSPQGCILSFNFIFYLMRLVRLLDSVLSSRNFICDICGPTRDLLLPVTSASSSTAKEAKELASQFIITVSSVHSVFLKTFHLFSDFVVFRILALQRRRLRRHRTQKFSQKFKTRKIMLMVEFPPPSRHSYLRCKGCQGQPTGCATLSFSRIRLLL